MEPKKSAVEDKVRRLGEAGINFATENGRVYLARECFGSGDNANTASNVLGSMRSDTNVGSETAVSQIMTRWEKAGLFPAESK